MRSREQMAADGVELGSAQIKRAGDSGLSAHGQTVVSLATTRLIAALQEGITTCGMLGAAERGPAVLLFMRNAREGLALLDRVSDEIMTELGQ